MMQQRRIRGGCRGHEIAHCHPPFSKGGTEGGFNQCTPERPKGITGMVEHHFENVVPLKQEARSIV
jgi:hypothetical protein